MADASVTWVQGEQFVASASGGHSVVLDAPGGREVWQGIKPTEMLLAALGGCSGIDVIDILIKKRQQVSGLRVTVHGEQRDDFPKAFERITVHFEVRGRGVSPRAVERSISLSQEKYCSVSATISGVAAITTSYTIVEDDAGTGE